MAAIAAVLLGRRLNDVHPSIIRVPYSRELVTTLLLQGAFARVRLAPYVGPN